MDLLADLVIAEVLLESTSRGRVGAWLVAERRRLRRGRGVWAESALAESEATTRAEARASVEAWVPPLEYGGRPEWATVGTPRKKGNPYASR